MAVPDQVAMRLDWSEVEDTSTSHINQLLAQIGPPSSNGVPDGLYIAMGSASPPVVMGDEDERTARIAELAGSVLRVAVHARVHVSREFLGDVIRVLEKAAEQYDAALALASKQRSQERV